MRLVFTSPGQQALLPRPPPAQQAPGAPNHQTLLRRPSDGLLSQTYSEAFRQAIDPTLLTPASVLETQSTTTPEQGSPSTRSSPSPPGSASPSK